MARKESGDITGKLDGVIRLQGKLGLEVGLKVGGEMFLKRFWNEDESIPKKRKIFRKLVDNAISQEESNYKEEFVEEHSQHIGEIVNVKFKRVKVNWPHYISDWIHGPKYPRVYREILSLSYQDQQPSTETL